MTYTYTYYLSHDMYIVTRLQTFSVTWLYKYNNYNVTWHLHKGLKHCSVTWHVHLSLTTYCSVTWLYIIYCHMTCTYTSKTLFRLHTHNTLSHDMYIHVLKTYSLVTWLSVHTQYSHMTVHTQKHIFQSHD